MTSKPILIAAIVILTVVIAAVAIWTIGPSSQSTPPPSSTPTPVKADTVTLGELVLCKDFQKIEGEITCEDTLSIAKKKYSGTVQKISQGIFRKTEDIQSPGIGIWIIQLKLNKPIVRNNNAFDRTRLFLRRDTGEEFSITRRAE